MKIPRWTCLFLLGAMATACFAQATLDGALGANFNGEYQDINFNDLTHANVRWIRGFIAMTKIDPQEPNAQIGISATLAAETRGFHTILTLKWPFQKSGLPERGSQRYTKTLDQLDSILPLIMGRVDIIEIGNEPYWETPAAQRNGDLNRFYEAMATRVIAYRSAHCHAPCRTHLFMGALNRLNRPAMQRAPWVKRWLEFARETPQIDGVDIHPHVDSLAASRPYVDYVLQRLRPDQKFLATEFSLVWYWKAHLNDRVPAGFAQKYGVPARLKMWQAIADAIKQPVSQREWNDLLEQSPWFASHRRYIDREMALFRGTGRLAVACYGFEQGASMTRKFGPDSPPWLLNSVYARRTVRSGNDGSAPTNPYWLAAFQRLNQQ